MTEESTTRAQEPLPTSSPDEAGWAQARTRLNARSWLLVVASSVGYVGWGTVLPYQFVYASETRHWGPMIAAVASALFSVGALVAAPFAGRLTDLRNPVWVVVASQVLAAVGVGSLLVADTPLWFCVGTLVFGMGMTASSPGKSVLVLHWSGMDDQRKVFAYRYAAEQVGLALGAFASGYFVDLSVRSGMHVSYALAVITLVVSALMIAGAGRGAPEPVTEPGEEGAGTLSMTRSLLLIFSNQSLRWVAVITVSLALAFYAQFEAGLPSYALLSLHATERTIGLAAAVNCVVIFALQFPVLKLTEHRGAAGLLMVVGAIWVLAWVILAVARYQPEIAVTLFVTSYGIFAVGETMYTPVLNPLTAALAPPHMVGTTLGAMAALQTTFSALGPLVAGVLIGYGLIGGFVGLHLLISVIAFLAAWRLRALLRASNNRVPKSVDARYTSDISMDPQPHRRDPR